MRTVRLTVLSALSPTARQTAANYITRRGDAVLLDYRHTVPGTLSGRAAVGSETLDGWLVDVGAEGVAAAVCADLENTLATARSLVPREHVVLGLPAGMDAGFAVDATRDPAIEIDSVITALDPVTVEEQLWDKTPLHDLEVPAVPGDPRTGGEFLVGELLHADTYVLTGSAHPAARAERGMRLINHIAPQARATSMIEFERVFPASSLHLRPLHLGTGRYDPGEALARTKPGAVTAPVLGDDIVDFTTVVCRLTRPCHPGRLVARMPELTAGSVWSRGKLWIASVPDRKVVWWGVGAEAGFEDGGPWPTSPRSGDTQDRLDWHPRFGAKGTVLGFTGERLDPRDFRLLLGEIALTDAELERGAAAWREFDDPLNLRKTLGQPSATTTE